MEMKNYLRHMKLISLAVFIAGTVASVTAQHDPSAFPRYHWHHEVVAFAEELAGSSDRVALKTYGMTPEGRPLQLLAFGLPEHLAELDAIQTNQQRRASGEETDERWDALAVVWLSYDVHGNEASCTEAALEVMAELADPASDRAGKWLQRLLVLVDPCSNPDGHDRYVHMVQQRRTAQPNPDPAAWSHHEPWPGGRLNHYLFDLNRDWAWARQPETQARLREYNAWLPLVHGDFHEMGYDSPYYFAPAASPYHEQITPWQREFQVRVGQAAAADFDARGERYFTREDFDLFYPSYGDTYPMFRGAIGMTYEQGGGPRSGLAVTRENGKVLTLADRVANHVHSSFALLDVCLDQTPTLVREATNYFEKARQGGNGPFGAYLFPSEQPGLEDLLSFFALHGIEFGHAAPPKKAMPGLDYLQGETRPITWNEHDWVVPVNQAQGTLLQVLMEPHPQLEDSLTYDITAWGLPFAHGLRCYGVEGQIEVEAAPAPSVAHTNMPTSQYGYAVVPRTAGARAWIAQAGAAGLAARVLTRDSWHGDRHLPPGTVCFLSDDQSTSQWAARLQEIAPAGIEVIALESGLANRGIDLGSDAVRWLPLPRIAVLAGEGTRALSVGEIWWHFESEWGITPTLIEAKDLPDLAEFDVLVVPAGVRGSLDPACEAFVKGGGTLIALGDALGSVAKWESTELEQNSIDAENESDWIPYGDRQRHWASQSIEGAIFALEVDVTHPIGYLEGPRAFALKQGTTQWKPLKRGVNVARYAQTEPVSGFVGHAATSGLAGTMAIGVEHVGAGRVVYFADNPLFRGFWEEGKAYFDRAVLFAPVY